MALPVELIGTIHDCAREAMSGCAAGNRARDKMRALLGVRLDAELAVIYTTPVYADGGMARHPFEMLEELNAIEAQRGAA